MTRPAADPPPPATLRFIVAGDPGQLTGGYVYDARIVAALRARGWTVEVVGLAGRFPAPDAAARRALDAALAAVPAGGRVVIDGLALGGLPEVAAAHAPRLRLTALVHHPLADETGLDAARRAAFFSTERAALATVERVIATSAFTARRLADFGVSPARLTVIEPGVDVLPLAPADHEPPRLLCVATLIPRKGHELLVAALARLAALAWTCDCIGSTTRDPAHAARLATAIAAHGLDERLRLRGELAGEALRDAYRGADLFVLPSHYEGYGMVITEALAGGLPVLTTTGGALADTLPPGAGLAVPPGDVDALTDALRRLLQTPSLRLQLRDGARTARATLKDWQASGDAFAAALLRTAASAPSAAPSRASRAGDVAPSPSAPPDTTPDATPDGPR